MGLQYNTKCALADTLRLSSSPAVITYDEHGGFADHVPPPQEGVPSPDGIDTVGGFNYTRLGVRIPTLLISPWVKRGTLVHEPPAQAKPDPTSQWELSSIPATMRKMFDLGGPLTKRDAWAATFDYLFDELDAPRTDCPTHLPDVPPPEEGEMERQTALPLNDHHTGKIAMLCEMNGRGPECGQEVNVQGDMADWEKREWDAWRARFE